MKLKLWLLVAIAAAIAFYIPDSMLYRESIWSYERLPGIRITKGDAERELGELRSKLQAAEKKGSYSAQQKYEIDETLQKIRFGLDLPVSYTIPGTTIVGYTDEAEVPDKSYWEVYRLESGSLDLAKQVGWAAASEAEYKRLRSRPEVQQIWNPQLKKYAKSRHVATLAQQRIWPLALFLLALLIWKLSRLGWVFRRLFSRQTLQFIGYLLSLGLSVVATPALAQQLIFKLRKEKRSDNKVEWLVPLPVPLDSPPLPHGEVRVETFGDFTHDRQEIVSGSYRITERLGLAFMNQNRQSATGPGALSFGGLGLKLRLFRPFTVTALTGPQYEWTKGRVDQQVTFVNGAYRSPRATITVVNRFSRGLDNNVSPAHRHILSIRAGPMPKWLTAQAEVKQTRGMWTESFWGPSVSYGQFLPRRVRNWLSGLYFFPHYDFIRRNWDLRFGFVKSFAIP